MISNLAPICNKLYIGGHGMDMIRCMPLEHEDRYSHFTSNPKSGASGWWCPRTELFDQHRKVISQYASIRQYMWSWCSYFGWFYICAHLQTRTFGSWTPHLPFFFHNQIGVYTKVLSFEHHQFKFNGGLNVQHCYFMNTMPHCLSCKIIFQQINRCRIKISTYPSLSFNFI